MTSLTQDIQDKLKQLTAYEKIIAINIVVFFIGWCITVVFDISRSSSLNWLELPNEFSSFLLKPWSLVTYGFTHIEFWHLFMNMFVLYFVGRSFSNLFNIKNFIKYIFLGYYFRGSTLHSKLCIISFFFQLRRFISGSISRSKSNTDLFVRIHAKS